MIKVKYSGLNFADVIARRGLYPDAPANPALLGYDVSGEVVETGSNVKEFSIGQKVVAMTRFGGYAEYVVISELVVGSKIVDLFNIAGGEHPTLQSQQVSGQMLAGGIAKAPIVLHRPKIDITQLVSDSPEEEEIRFHGALLELQQSVDALIDSSGLEEGSAHREILESYRLFSQDRGWIDRIIEAIRTGLTAEAAVRKVQEEMHARLNQITSAYIQERVHDLEDLSERLLYHLQGVEPTAAQGDLPDAFILVANSLGPAELLEYDAKRLRGVILAEGSSTSHVAIIARRRRTSDTVRG